MVTISREDWRKIHKDFKGTLADGTRSCFAGCIPGGKGTTLWSEGVHFKIEPELPPTPQARRIAAQKQQIAEKLKA